jgi:predicted DNA-binding transcriptional regulator AlpA
MPLEPFPLVRKREKSSLLVGISAEIGLITIGEYFARAKCPRPLHPVLEYPMSAFATRERAPSHALFEPLYLMTTEEVLALTQWSLSTLDRHVRNGTFPAPLKLGRGNRWKRDRVISHLENLETR